MTGEIIDVKVLTEHEALQIEVEILKYIKLGYTLKGGTQIAAYVNQGKAFAIYSQTMVKYKIQRNEKN